TDPDPASTPGFLVVHDQEYHTSYWGHTGLLGLSDHYLLPEYVGYPNTAAASLYPMNADVADLAHAQGALFGYVHPFDTPPDPSDTTAPLDRKSTRLNSSHVAISYAVFCLKKKNTQYKGNSTNQ